MKSNPGLGFRGLGHLASTGFFSLISYPHLSLCSTPALMKPEVVFPWMGFYKFLPVPGGHAFPTRITPPPPYAS